MCSGETGGWITGRVLAGAVQVSMVFVDITRHHRVCQASQVHATYSTPIGGGCAPASPPLALKHAHVRFHLSVA